MGVMWVMTIVAMVEQIRGFYLAGHTLLLVVAVGLMGVAAWLVVEAVLAVRRYRRGEVAETLDVLFDEQV
jgi:hypothetical protein